MFRIAHLSDIHIHHLSLKFSYLFSKRWLGMTNLFMSRKKKYKSIKQIIDLKDLLTKEKIDLIVVTGDLTTTSLKEEFIQAKKLLDSLEIPYLTLPGNHDKYTKKSEKQKDFYSYFSNSIQSIPKNYHNLSLKNDRLEIHDIAENWKLILLDTALATSLVFSTGKFFKKTEILLENLLSKEADQTIILATHFPFYQPLSKRKSLKRKEALLNLLKKHPNVKIYLHGHTHEHTILDLRPENLPIILDSGSTGHNFLGKCNILSFDKNICQIDVWQWKDHWHKNTTKEFSIL